MSRQGSNSIQLRHYNERVVLDAVRKLGEASKAEIARIAHLTPPAVAAIVDALMAAGYIAATSKRSGYVGSPSQMVGLAADGAYSIGLHVGRRSLECLLVDFLGHTRHAFSHEYDFPEPEHVARLANRDLMRLKEKLPSVAKDRLIGLGVAMPYFLGGWTAELGFPKEVVKAWASANLQQFLAENSGLSVYIENDASAAATAELVYGLGRSNADFLYLSLNTFIGGGLVIDGKLQTGPNGNTAALGPFPIGPSRLSTVAPPSGPFEVLLHRASIFVLINHLRSNGVKINRIHDLEDLGEAARPFLREWQADTADALAQTIIGAISIVDVSAVIIDGILPRPILAETVSLIESRFKELAPEGIVPPKILSGSIGPNAAAIGAAILPFYAMFAPDSDVLVKKQKSDKRGLLIGLPGRLTLAPDQPSSTTNGTTAN